jgi:hypothetical protein
MKQPEQKCYVYMYRLEGVPIYVGIGTEDNGLFQRAYQLSAHPSIAQDEFGKVQIDIIYRNMSRLAARKLETLLIQILKQNHTLRNINLSHNDTDIRTIKTVENMEQQIIKKDLELHKNELIEECIEFLNHSGPAIHNIFLEPKLDNIIINERDVLLSILIPDYSLEIESIIEQFHQWCKEVDFNPEYDKVVIIVPTMVLAELLHEGTKDILFATTRSSAVLTTSLEQWAHVLLHNRKTIKNSYKL